MLSKDFFRLFPPGSARDLLKKAQLSRAKAESISYAMTKHQEKLTESALEPWDDWKKEKRGAKKEKAKKEDEKKGWKHVGKKRERNRTPLLVTDVNA